MLQLWCAYSLIPVVAICRPRVTRRGAELTVQLKGLSPREGSSTQTAQIEEGTLLSPVEDYVLSRKTWSVLFTERICFPRGSAG